MFAAGSHRDFALPFWHDLQGLDLSDRGYPLMDTGNCLRLSSVLVVNSDHCKPAMLATSHAGVFRRRQHGSDMVVVDIFVILWCVSICQESGGQAVTYVMIK